MLRRKSTVEAVTETLESRRLLTITVAGTSASDLIRIAADGSQVLVVINGTQSRYALDSAGIVLNAGDGNDTIRLEDASNLPVTIDGGALDDLILVGNGNVRAARLSTVSVVGGAGRDTLNVDDSLATTGNPSVVIDNPIDTYVSVVAATGTLIRSDASTSASAVESVVYTGTPLADTVTVSGSNALVSLAVNTGAGADSVTVGKDIDTYIKGAVALDGGADANVLTFDDSADSFTDTYYFANVGALGSLRKNSGGATTTFANFGNASLIAGLAGPPENQTFRVSSLPGAMNLSIYAGSGDDVLFFGDGIASLDALQAAVTFYGQDGVDSITYTDTVGTDAASYELGPTSLTNTGTGTLSFVDCEALLLVANNANNDIRATTMAGGLSVTLNGGGGNDTIRVGNGDLDSNFPNAVSAIGGSGTDALIIDDSQDDLGDDSYAVSAGVVQKLSSAAFWSTATADRVESVSLLCSQNSDAVTIYSVTPSIALNIATGNGDDSILVASTTDGTGAAAATITIVSGAGNDTLDVNSDFANADAIVAIPAGEDYQELRVRAGGKAALIGGSASIVNVRGPLTLAGILDIANGTLIASGADAASLQALAVAGYSGGTWAGGGATAAIVSSVAAATPTADVAAVALSDDLALPAFNGMTTKSGDVILRYTIAGDVTLDRSVNFSDLVILAQHYGQTGQRWSQGNLNYDASNNVDFGDLVVLAQNYNQTLAVVAKDKRTTTTRLTETIL